MPKKIGNGGHSQEEYDENTGKYVADGKPNKYYDNPKENKILSALGLQGKTDSLSKVPENKVLDNLGLGENVVYYNNELSEDDIFDLIPKDGRIFTKDIKNKTQYALKWKEIYDLKTDLDPNFTPIPPTHLINTPERINFRNKLIKQEIERQLKSSPKKYERKAVLVLGQPASGKSFATRKFLSENGAFEIDGDIFTHLIPEFQKDSRNVSSVHKKAMDMSKEMLSNIMKDGANFVIGKVGGGAYNDLKKLLDNFSDNGYTIEVVFGDIPLEKSLQRNLNRHLQGEPRLVPPTVAINSEMNIFENLSKILNHNAVTGGEIYNNDVPFGKKPELLKKFVKRKGN